MNKKKTYFREVAFVLHMYIPVHVFCTGPIDLCTKNWSWDIYKFQHHDECHSKPLPRMCYRPTRCKTHVPPEHSVQIPPAKINTGFIITALIYIQPFINQHQRVMRALKSPQNPTLWLLLPLYNIYYTTFEQKGPVTSYFVPSAHVCSPRPSIKPSAKFPWRRSIATVTATHPSELLHYLKWMDWSFPEYYNIIHSLLFKYVSQKSTFFWWMQLHFIRKHTKWIIMIVYVLI